MKGVNYSIAEEREKDAEARRMKEAEDARQAAILEAEEEERQQILAEERAKATAKTGKQLKKKKGAYDSDDSMELSDTDFQTGEYAKKVQGRKSCVNHHPRLE